MVESRSQSGSVGSTSSVPIPDPTALTTEAVDRLHKEVSREITGLRELIETRLTAMDSALNLVQNFRNGIPAMIDEKVSRLEQVVGSQFNGISKISDERLKALNLRSDGFTEVTAERFRGIENRFVELYSRIEQTARDSKVAVDAAFAAAKEAVGEQNKSNALSITKSEAATTKQLDLISTSMATTSSNTDGKIADLKDRIGTVESRMANVASTAETRALSVAAQSEARANAIDIKLSTFKSSSDGTTTGQNNVWGALATGIAALAAVIAIIISIAALKG